jgi:hypothetical protein
MSDDGSSRVHYFEQQFLRAQDFTDEQAYHLALHRRHNIGHHTWGIVVGLDLVVEEGSLFVLPGAAVDGFGRNLVLPERLPVPAAAFADKNSDLLTVWLGYERTGGDPAPDGYAGCDEDDDVPFYRWQERPRLFLEAPDPDFPDRRAPETVPAGDLGFDASRPPPDDPSQDWPVFLGQVTRDPANADQPYVVDPDGRPYVGLVGEAVLAPSGRALVQLSAELDADPYRFAVYVPDAETAADRRKPRLAVTRGVAGAAGGVELRGDTTLHGNLSLAGRAVELQPGPERAATDPSWRLYHVQDITTDHHELRIEIPSTPGAQAGQGPPQPNQVVVGSWSAEEERFVPCLTVAADGTVTVHGKLVVTGQVVEHGGTTGAALDEQAKQLAMAGFLAGVGGASNLLDRLYQGSFGGPGVLARGLGLGGPPTPEASLRAVAAMVAADEARLAEFAGLLNADPDAAARLRQALGGGEQP